MHKDPRTPSFRQVIGGRSIGVFPRRPPDSPLWFDGRPFNRSRLTEAIPSAARLALDRIGNRDALYHTVEHTMLVTLAGYDIMWGRALLMPTDVSDFAEELRPIGEVP